MDTKRDRIRSMSAAAKEAYAIVPSEKRKRGADSSRSAASALKDWAQVLSAAALVVIGWLTWDLNTRFYKLNSDDVSEKQLLLSEIRQLEINRDNLYRDISKLELDYTSASGKVETYEQRVELLDAETSALRQQISTRGTILDELERDRQNSENALTGLKTKLATESVVVAIRTSVTRSSFTGRSMRAIDFVGAFGTIQEPRNVEFYYSLPRDQIWAEVTAELKTVPDELPEEQREIARQLIRRFVDACRPTNSATLFSFDEPYPEFEEDQDYHHYATQLLVRATRSQREDWEEEKASAKLVVDRNTEAAEQFISRFNQARANYISAIWDELLLCPENPGRDLWITARSTDATRSSALRGDVFSRLERYHIRD